MTVSRRACGGCCTLAEAYPWRPVLLAGSVCDPETGVTTYGGQRRRDWHPLRYALVTPPDVPTTVDTVNGNVLLVPRETYRLLGHIDGGFAHSYADMDYGLRLRQAGGENVLIPGHVGTCAANKHGAREPGSVPAVVRAMAVLSQPEGDPAALTGPLSASARRPLLAHLPTAAVCPSAGRPLVPGCQPSCPGPRHSWVVTVIGQLLGSPETAFYAACALLVLAVAVLPSCSSQPSPCGPWPSCF